MCAKDDTVSEVKLAEPVPTRKFRMSLSFSKFDKWLFLALFLGSITFHLAFTLPAYRTQNAPNAHLKEATELLRRQLATIEKNREHLLEVLQKLQQQRDDMQNTVQNLTWIKRFDDIRALFESARGKVQEMKDNLTIGLIMPIIVIPCLIALVYIAHKEKKENTSKWREYNRTLAELEVELSTAQQKELLVRLKERMKSISDPCFDSFGFK